MNDRRKRSILKDAPTKSKSMENEMHQNVKFRRGIEPEEMHRQGGNKVPDQGSHKH